MGWREMIARRRRKEEVEDARYPPRLRTAGYGRDGGSHWLLGAPAVILSWVVYELWMVREYLWLGVVCAMILLAAGFAWHNMRNHRSRTAKQLREELEAESEADRVSWEE